MSSHPVLFRIAWLHAALISLAALALLAAGLPIQGTLLGGGLIGFSFVAFWVFTRAIVEPRRTRTAVALGVLKLLLYAVLGAAVLSGRLVTDGGGFALGVTVFVLTAIGVGLTTPARGKAET